MSTTALKKLIGKVMKQLDIPDLEFQAACDRHDARLLLMEEEFLLGPMREERREKGLAAKDRDEDAFRNAAILVAGDSADACRRDHETMVRYCMRRYGSTAFVDRRWAWGASYAEIWDYFLPRYLDYMRHEIAL